MDNKNDLYSLIIVGVVAIVAIFSLFMSLNGSGLSFKNSEKIDLSGDAKASIKVDLEEPNSNTILIFYKETFILDGTKLKLVNFLEPDGEYVEIEVDGVSHTVTEGDSIYYSEKILNVEDVSYSNICESTVDYDAGFAVGTFKITSTGPDYQVLNLRFVPGQPYDGFLVYDKTIYFIAYNSLENDALIKICSKIDQECAMRSISLGESRIINGLTVEALSFENNLTPEPFKICSDSSVTLSYIDSPFE